MADPITIANATNMNFSLVSQGLQTTSVLGVEFIVFLVLLGMITFAITRSSSHIILVMLPTWLMLSDLGVHLPGWLDSLGISFLVLAFGVSIGFKTPLGNMIGSIKRTVTIRKYGTDDEKLLAKEERLFGKSIGRKTRDTMQSLNKTKADKKLKSSLEKIEKENEKELDKLRKEQEKREKELQDEGQQVLSGGVEVK